MGNCNCDDENIIEKIEQEKENKLKPSDFTKLYQIGKSSISHIWKVHHVQDNSKIYAMKVINKAKIYFNKLIQSAEINRKLMELLNYKLLCKMYYAFQDTDNLYLIVEYFSGGDLRYHICKRDYFTEKETKFITACIALIINYMHENNVVHRDIKPEKLVFDKNGYLHITDFAIAKELKKGETCTWASGTPQYMAPEALINKPHDYMVDYYALGIILYELTMGERPYNGQNRKEIKERLFSREVNLDKDDIPVDWDVNILDMINGLLKWKKKKRLGNNGFNDIKNHPWFKDFDWEKMEKFELNSPFVIEKEDNFDESYVQKPDDESIYEGKKDFYINKINESLVFKDYYFNYENKI